MYVDMAEKIIEVVEEVFPNANTDIDKDTGKVIVDVPFYEPYFTLAQLWDIYNKLNDLANRLCLLDKSLHLDIIYIDNRYGVKFFVSL